jgi:hypothetical protein
MKPQSLQSSGSMRYPVHHKQLRQHRSQPSIQRLLPKESFSFRNSFTPFQNFIRIHPNMARLACLVSGVERAIQARSGLIRRNALQRRLRPKATPRSLRPGRSLPLECGQSARICATRHNALPKVSSQALLPPHCARVGRTSDPADRGPLRPLAPYSRVAPFLRPLSCRNYPCGKRVRIGFLRGIQPDQFQRLILQARWLRWARETEADFLVAHCPDVRVCLDALAGVASG